MKEYFKIAWRNLWRNKRRTVITVSSIFFAVFFAILMRSFQLGTYDNMLDNMVTHFTGHLQIQEVDYFDNPQIDNSFVYDERIMSVLDSCEKVTFYTPRINTGVLASSGNISKVAMVLGIDCNKERQLSNFDEKTVKFFVDEQKLRNIDIPPEQKEILSAYYGSFYTNAKDFAEDLFADGFDTVKYFQIVKEKTKFSWQSLTNNSETVLVGYKLAQFLEINPGDSIILIGQGFHGASAIGKYKVAGFLKFPTDAFNERFIYMPIKTCQNFLSAYEIRNNDTLFYVNYVVVNTIYKAGISKRKYERLLALKKQIEKSINRSDLTVIGWRKLNKDLTDGIEIDNNSGKIMLGVLYLIIAFGVLGTVMMMIAERKREFGVMLALGMKRSQLSLIVAIEMFFMGFIALISGIIVTAPVIWIGHNHPITLHGETAKALQMYNMEPVMPFAWFGSYILYQVLVVFVIVLIVLIYALIKIRKLKVIDALRA